MSRHKKRRHTPSDGASTQTAPRNQTLVLPSTPTLAERLYERLEKVGVISAPAKPVAQVAHIPIAIRPEPTTTLHNIVHQTDAIARANQQHYLQEAARTARPWFQCPRFQYQYSEFVMVNEAMAQQALDHNPDNRRIRDDFARSLARDILNKRWLPTAESVAFDISGNLQNGQHRMLAITIASGEVAIYITWNVAVESKFVIDCGMKRTTIDKLRPLASQKIGNKTTAVCRACIAGVRPRGRYTDSEVAEFLLTHEESLRWTARELPSARADVQAVVLKGYLWYGEDKVKVFCDNFRLLNFSGDGDPVRLLYKWLSRLRGQGTQVSPTTVYRKTLSALEHFINNRQLRALYERDVDLFEWGPGYTVPQHTA